MVSFSQLSAVKKDNIFGAARKIFSPSYFVAALSKSVHQLSSNIATALLVLTLFSIENPSTQLSNLSLLTQFAAVGKQEAYCAEQKRRQNVVQKYMYVVKRVFSVLFVLQLIEKTTIRHTLRDAPIATRLVGGPQ